jgi:hypothetical protein
MKLLIMHCKKHRGNIVTLRTSVSSQLSQTIPMFACETRAQLCENFTGSFRSLNAESVSRSVRTLGKRSFLIWKQNKTKLYK